MSLVHSQSETVSVTIPTPPPSEVIVVISKNMPGSAQAGTHYIGTITVKNNDSFQRYTVWLVYVVSGVGTFQTPVVGVFPQSTALLNLEFDVPDHDVTVDMQVYAERYPPV